MSGGSKSAYWAESDAAFMQRLQLQAQYGRLDNRPIIDRNVVDTVFQLAPNAVEWLTRSEFIGNDLLFHYKRSYQVARDYFQLRCPHCNDPSPEAADPWDKPRSYLESEVLLVWNEEYQEDQCPKCRVVRSELADAGLVIPYDELHVVAGMRCIAGSTAINTSAGVLTAEELAARSRGNPAAESGALLSEVRVMGRSGAPVEAARVFDTGDKRCVTVTTRLGYTLTTAEDHRYLVLADDLTERWVSARELQSGDVVWAAREQTCGFGPVRMPADHARLLGYLIGNGSVSSKKWVKFSHEHESVVADCVRTINEGFGASISYQPCRDRKGFEFSRGKPAFRAALFEQYGLAYERARAKTVPLSVRSGDRATVAEFLKGLFTCDGFASLGSSGSTRTRSDRSPTQKVQVGLDSVSEALIDQVRLLLLQFGIRCSKTSAPVRKFRQTKNTSPGSTYGHRSYRLIVCAEDVGRFAETVGFVGPEKNSALRACVEHQQTQSLREGRGKPRGSESTIARGAAVLQNLLAELPNGDELSKQATRVLGHGVRSLDVRKLGRIAEVLAVHGDRRDAKTRKVQRRLEEVAERAKSFQPVQVLSVRDAGVHATYDLHVPDGNAYVAAGLLTHNSGKTLTLSGIATFMMHWLLCRGFREKAGLAGYLGLGRMSSFEFGFVAASKDQTEATAWSYFQKMIRGSPWYRRFREWILIEQRKQPPGEKNWAFADLDLKLTIDHPLVGLEFVALSGNPETSAGRTRIGSVVDEMGRMNQNVGGKFSAEEVYRTQANSMQTVRAKVRSLGLPSWIGSIMSCTSRRWRDGYEIKLYNKRQELPRSYMLKCPTWEFNPDITFDSLKGEFVKNYAAAMLHFGCEVVEDEEMLVDSVERFVPQLVRPSIRPSMLFDYPIYTNSSGDELWDVKLREVDMSFPAASPESPRVIAVDNGQTFDCLTMACGHGVWAGEGAHKQFVTVLDWMIRLVPRKSRKARLIAVVEIARAVHANYRHFYEIRFDRWNSATQQEILRDDGINATVGKSPNATEMRAFKGAVEDGRVWAPMPEADDYKLDERGWFQSPLISQRPASEMSAIGAAIHELTRLKDDGVKVYNPDKGRVKGVNSDDAALVLARVHTMVQKLGHVADADAQGRKAQKKRSEWQGIRPKHDDEIWAQSPSRARMITSIRPQFPVNPQAGSSQSGRRGVGYGNSAAPGVGIFGGQGGGSLFRGPGGRGGGGNGGGGRGGRF